MPGAFDDDGDAASTASISSGVPGKAQSGNSITKTNKPLPTAPGNTSLTGSGVTGTGNTAAGPHSSNLENKLDPRVDSDLDGLSGLGGRGQTGGMGSGLDSDRSFPLRGGSSNVGSGTGGYSAPGQVGTYPAGGAGPGSSMTAGPHSSNLENKMDPRVDSDRDGRSGMGNTGVGSTGSGYGSNTGVGSTGSGYGSNTTAGPHSSNLENKMDPRVDSDRDGRSGLGNTGVGSTGTGYGSGTGPSATSSNTGRIVSGAGMTSEHSPDFLRHAGHSHEYQGDPCGPEAAAPGAPHFTTGPHATDTANRLDPHVNSGIGAPGSTTGSGFGTSTGTDRGLSSNTGTGTGLGSSGTSSDPYGSSSTGTGRHHGRDAALGAGAGAAGVGAYEAGRDSTQSSATGPAPTTAGPHKSDMLNKLDPRVDSDLSKQQGGATSSEPYGSSTGTGQHHTGRDAALAGGAGAAGLGAYEADKHHNHQDPSGLGSSTTGASHHSHHQGHHDRQEQAKEHHHGRDAALAGGAGAAGVGAYEAEKHHHQQDLSGLGSSTTEPHHSHHHGHHDRQEQAREHHTGRDAGLAGAGTAAAYEAERHHGHPTQSSTVPSTTPGMTSSSRDPAVSGQDSGHHYGRDAGLVGAGGVGAYEADKHLGHHNQGTSAQGTGPTGLTGNTGIGGMQSDVPSSGQKDHHLGRDAGLAAGAGGAAYEADKHHHNKEARNVEHDQEYQPHQEQHDSGKKSGGILGLFHRDKGDKEAKKEEKAEEKAERKAEKEYRKEEKAEEKAEHHHKGRDAALGAGGAATAYEAREQHRHGNESMGAGAGTQSGYPTSTSGTRDFEQGAGDHGGMGVGPGTGMGRSQAAMGDSAISSGSGVGGVAGSGPTTHNAYGENDPNRLNRLHKDPPRGL